jgi:dUTP pyrophosphatase
MVDAVLGPGERSVIPTGIAISIPEGYAGFVQPRSGLAAKSGISIVNTPGLIDSHYRGEVKVVLVNLDPSTPFEVKRGDKICQLVFQRVERAEFEETDELDETARGNGGFGSTGT